MGNNKSSFWMALILTIIIFAIGFILGFFLETYRSNSVEINLMNSEINLLDEQVRQQVMGDFNVNCLDSKESTFNFANSIYTDAIRMEDYDRSTKFSDTLTLLHQRYDLLRMMLWDESVQIKKKCKSDFHTVVYVYEYNSENLEKESKQKFFSNILLDLKNKYPNDILLIPMAGNTNLVSINVTMKSYNVTDFPVIIIDEKKVLSNITTLNDLEKEVFGK